MWLLPSYMYEPLGNRSYTAQIFAIRQDLGDKRYLVSVSWKDGICQGVQALGKSVYVKGRVVTTMNVKSLTSTNVNSLTLIGETAYVRQRRKGVFEGRGVCQG